MKEIEGKTLKERKRIRRRAIWHKVEWVLWGMLFVGAIIGTCYLGSG